MRTSCVRGLQYSLLVCMFNTQSHDNNIQSSATFLGRHTALVISKCLYQRYTVWLSNMSFFMYPSWRYTKQLAEIQREILRERADRGNNTKTEKYSTSTLQIPPQQEWMSLHRSHTFEVHSKCISHNIHEYRIILLSYIHINNHLYAKSHFSILKKTNKVLHLCI